MELQRCRKGLLGNHYDSTSSVPPPPTRRCCTGVTLAAYPPYGRSAQLTLKTLHQTDRGGAHDTLHVKTRIDTLLLPRHNFGKRIS